MKKISAFWLAAGLAIIGVGWSTQTQAAQDCVAGVWQSPPNSIFDSLNSSFPVQAESEHFQLRWADEFNADTRLTQAILQKSMEAMEQAWDWFVSEPVNWPEPFCNQTTKYKLQVFAHPDYGLTGSGNGSDGLESMAMWINIGTFEAMARGEVGGFVHEMTHSFQFASGGLRNTDFGGWFWESHAEFMAYQYPPLRQGVGCTLYQATMPHLYYGSTRVRYCNWQFWDFLQNKYGYQVINDIWHSAPRINNQDPFILLRDSQGWSQQQLGDHFGEFAMKNVTWDYQDPYDGFDGGERFRAFYGSNSDMKVDTTKAWEASKALRQARLEATDEDNGRYQVVDYYAPQRYGYNLVRLYPASDANSITVDFKGSVQTGINPLYSPEPIVNTPGISIPGYPNHGPYRALENPGSDWRWGLVAVSMDGAPRYSALQRGAEGSLSFDITADTAEVYLVVAATPSVHHPVFWDQVYNSLYRFPYGIQLANAYPDGYQPGFSLQQRHQIPAGAPHPNGGGWVANNAQVAASAYVGPNAAVAGGQVLDNARIEDYAIVWDGLVRENAVVGGLTQLVNNVSVAGNAELRVAAAGHAAYDWGTQLAGSVKLFGDVETRLGSSTVVDRGVFSGYTDLNSANKTEWGADRNQFPEEVSLPIAIQWPEVPTEPDPEVVLPTAAIQCGEEWIDDCDIPAGVIATVWYGANNSWNQQTGLTGTVPCNNDQFGDPIYGVGKSCWYVIEQVKPIVAFAQPANNSLFSSGSEVDFVVNAEVAVGAITKVELYSGEDLFATLTQPPFVYPVTNAPEGRYAITALAYETGGTTARTEVLNITVEPGPNVPPTVALLFPGNNAQFTTADTIEFQVAVNDLDGYVARVDYYAGDLRFASLWQPPFTHLVTDAPPGVYEITAHAHDNNGDVTVSESIQVTVTE